VNIKVHNSQEEASMYRAVLYISDSTLSENPDRSIEAKKINDISSKSNKEHDICGVLAHCNNRFLHILEGDDSAISTLLENIKNDSRNTDLTIILDIKKVLKSTASYLALSCAVALMNCH